ncbi:Pollen Ole e 1 allergen/extensin [Melia azedarach]|uniref:Pollen Ole e 1 allergen/extensin n=1 Tax=Melia azedarach TaxID=155640 RepID=A0ACC1XJ35_MELAZ|nr:Pollen Ole e 1 allergen/extensin [Melia azedarach]
MLLQKLLQTSPMSTPIHHFLSVLLAFLFVLRLSAIAEPTTPTSRITVVGVVFCDTCSTNAFSRHSYFLPGADVHIQCKFKANSPKTAEQITFSVNRTTDKYGVYKLEIPHVDGVDCVDGMAIESLCQASLIGSSSSACNVPGLKTATNEISVKSKQDSLCIYSLKALSYRPSERNATLCGNHKEEVQKSLNSTKFVLPYYFPSYGFFWPPLAELPPSLPFPPLFPSPPSLPFPPLFPSPPSLPFPPLFPSPPSLPFPPLFPSPPSLPPLFPSPPPSLPFPFPPLPPFTPAPSLFQPPPPPAFNLGDPRTWIPNFPTLSPPPPPAFNLGDPRTWIPYTPPSPPSITQNQDQKP